MRHIKGVSRQGVIPLRRKSFSLINFQPTFFLQRRCVEEDYIIWRNPPIFIRLRVPTFEIFVYLKISISKLHQDHLRLIGNWWDFPIRFFKIEYYFPKNRLQATCVRVFAEKKNQLKTRSKNFWCEENMRSRWERVSYVTRARARDPSYGFVFQDLRNPREPGVFWNVHGLKFQRGHPETRDILITVTVLKRSISRVHYRFRLV